MSARLARWLLPVAARAPLSLLAALLFVRFADEWFSFFPAGALEPIRSELHLSYAQMGLVVAALPAGGLVGQGFTVAADFVGRRPLASLGALAYGLCLIAFATSGGLPTLLVAGFVWGAASDAFVHGAEVELVDLYAGDLAPVLGRVNAFGAAGDLLGPVTLAAAAAIGVSWRGVFTLGGALMVLYAGWLALQPFPVRRSHPLESSPVKAVLGVMRDRRIIVLAIVSGLFGLLDEPLLGFIIAFLERVRGLPPAAATAIVATTTAAGIAGFLSVPLFTRRVAPAPVLTGAAVLVTLGIMALVTVPIAALLVVAAGTFGFAAATFYALLQATYLGLRPGQAGTSQAVVSTIGLFGIGFPALVGTVSDRFGLVAGLGLYAAVAASIVLLVLFLVASRIVPRENT